MFGTPAPATGTSLWGASTPAATSTPFGGGGLFGAGASSSAAPLFGAGSMFGGAGTTPASSAAPTTSLFGGLGGTTSTATTTPGTSLLGGTGAFGSSLVPAATNTAGAVAPLPPPLSASQPGIDDPTPTMHDLNHQVTLTNQQQPDGQYRFVHFFYDRMMPNAQPYRYTPAQEVNPHWKKAKKNNPDYRVYQPKLHLGFEGLHSRLQQQQVWQQKLDVEVNKHMEAMQSLVAKTSARKAEIQELKAKQREQAHRICQLMTRIEQLQAYGGTLTASEAEYDRRLSMLSKQINSNMGLRQKVDEVKRMTLENMEQGAEYAVSVSKQAEEKLTRHLASQSHGLSELTRAVQRCEKSLVEINKKIAASGR